MAIDSNTMQQIVASVFEEMFDMTTEYLDPSTTEISEDRIVASIQISGEKQQAIAVEAPKETAAFIAETMFAVAPGELDDEEVRDAIGEVVNMIGGNVKGTYDGDSKLSLPFVSELCESSPCNDESQFLTTNVSGHPMLVRWQDVISDVHIS